MSSSSPPPPRVVSLVPAATEVVCLLGAQHLLVARGHGCDFPPSVKSLPPVTSSKIKFTTSQEVDDSMAAMDPSASLYQLDESTIAALHPSLILTQGLCSVCAVSSSVVHSMANRFPSPPTVISLSPTTVDDIINDVSRIGDAVGLSSTAASIAASLRQRVAAARDTAAAAVAAAGGFRPKIGFMEWTTPIFVGGHWTPQIIKLAGGEHPLNPAPDENSAAGASFRVSPAQFADVDPDWVIVAPCGLDIETTRRELVDVASQDWWRGLRAVREGRVALVDGNHMFSRSGPRVVEALEWLVALLHGTHDMMPKDFPWQVWQPR